LQILQLALLICSWSADAEITIAEGLRWSVAIHTVAYLYDFEPETVAAVLHTESTFRAVPRRTGSNCCGIAQVTGKRTYNKYEDWTWTNPTCEALEAWPVLSIFVLGWWMNHWRDDCGRWWAPAWNKGYSHCCGGWYYEVRSRQVCTTNPRTGAVIECHQFQEFDCDASFRQKVQRTERRIRSALVFSR